MKIRILPIGFILATLISFISSEGFAQCTLPSNLSYTGLSPSSATISWTSPGANTWVVEYGPKGFTQGNGTLVASNSTSTTISGLTENLIYDFYVMADCGGTSSGWSGVGEFSGTLVLCDDMDGYNVGLAGPQSILLQEWAGAGGDASISTDYSSSAPSSLKIYDSGPNAFSDVVAEVGVTTSGIHSVNFDFFIPVNFGGYYNILHNYVGSGTNVWAIEVYLDSAGQATVNEGSNGTGVIGTYDFNVGQWNTVEHIIDLDNDTAFILVNGSFTDVGWQFSLGSTNFGDQFNAVNFYSAANVGQTPLIYFDNFCMGPAPIDDVGLTQFVLSNPQCGDSNYHVQAVVRNNAMNNQNSFNITANVTGTATASNTIAYSELIRPGELDTVEITPVNTLAGGLYNFEAYTSLIGDTDISNDSVAQSAIAFLPGVSAQLGPADTAYCEGESIQFNWDVTNPNSNYQWSTGNTTATESADSAGVYSVTVTSNNGCTITDQITITEEPVIPINIGNDQSFCEGSNVLLFLNAGNQGESYDWSTGDTTQIIEVNNFGTYSVEVLNDNGCYSRDTVFITENPLPTVDLADYEFCGGDSAVLDAGNPGAFYEWSVSSQFGQTLTVTQSGTYTVTVTDTNNCESSDSSIVVVNTNPFVMLGADTTIVEGNSVTLDAGYPGSSYDWSTGENTQTITVNQTGVYSVTVTDQNGCDGSDEIEIEVVVGISERFEGSMSFYPNPVQNVLNLKIALKASGEMQIKLFNVNGQRVEMITQSIDGSAQTTTIDMNDLSSGVYIMQVTLDGEQVATYRVTKQ